MPIEISWYDAEKTIGLCRFIGDWRWADFFHLLAQSEVIERESPSPIAVIVDFSESRTSAHNVLSTFNAGEGRAPKNVEVFVVVGNAFVQAMLHVYRRISAHSRYRFHAAYTVKEAYELIRAERATQPERAAFELPVTRD